MTASTHLLLHNAGMFVSGIFVTGMAIFSYFNNRHRVSNITLSLIMVSVMVFIVSHLIGVNTYDSKFSQSILMLNVCIMFLVMFDVHTVFSVLDKSKQRTHLLIFFYSVGILLTIFYFVVPDSFLLESAPKMYFPNYYVPGHFHWVMRVIFNGLVPMYLIYELITAYRRSVDAIERNRLRYFFVAHSLGYIMGLIPVLLIFNIPVDPAWGSLFVFFFGVPFMYAVLKYELLDITIVAKKASIYAVTILIIGGLIVLLNISNRWIEDMYGGLSFLITPLITSILVLMTSIIVWRRLREDDILKYEFITTATHKFRTPLTHIKWSTENLEKAQSDEERNIEIGYIKSANAKLVELTNLLVNVSDTDNVLYRYQFKRNNLSSMLEEIAESVADQCKVKNIKLVLDFSKDIYANYDNTRLKFVAQTLIDNAVNYCSNGAKITVSVRITSKNILCSVADNGIGISKEELSLMFSKFYRGERAKLSDTEGIGIGLFVSRKIMSRHGGKIWAESEGPGKGSIFYFSLPVIDKKA